MLRDVLCAAAFGAEGMWAAFSVAFMIPNLFRRLFGEGALSSAFIPVFSQIRQQGDEERARRIAGTVIVSMSLILITLVILGEGVNALLYSLIAPTERNHVTLRLTAIMLPFAWFICVVAVMGGLLNVLGHFAAPALAPSILNIAILSDIAVGWFIPGLTVESRLVIIAWAVVVAGVFEVILQWGAMRRCGFKLKLSLDLKDEAVRQIAMLTGPMILGLAVVQVNTLADSLVAYWFVPHDGAPAKLYYAQRLYQFPEGVFLTAIATAIYPQFSLMVARKDMAGFGESIVRGLRMCLFIGLPASVGLILIREPLVGLLLQRKAFTAADTIRTAEVLACYASGVWAYGLQMMLVRAFYALQDSKTPVRIAVAMVALNFSLNIVLVNVLPEPQERGVALATSLCAVIQSVWLARRLVRRMGHINWSGLWNQAIRVGIATLAMTLACWCVGGWLGHHRTVQLAGLLIVGMGVFFAASRLMHIEELSDLMHLRRRRQQNPS